MNQNLPSALAELQAACADLTVRLNQTYAELAGMEARVRGQEEAVGRREHAVAQLLAEAEREARALSERTRTRPLEAGVAANGGRASLHIDAIEQQIARRLAELGRQDVQLQAREERLVELVGQQQTERDWLNRYAQSLTAAAAEIGQTLDEIALRPPV